MILSECTKLGSILESIWEPKFDTYNEWDLVQNHHKRILSCIQLSGHIIIAAIEVYNADTKELIETNGYIWASLNLKPNLTNLTYHFTNLTNLYNLLRICQFLTNKNTAWIRRQNLWIFTCWTLLYTHKVITSLLLILTNNIRICFEI